MCVSMRTRAATAAATLLVLRKLFQDSLQLLWLSVLLWLLFGVTDSLLLKFSSRTPLEPQLRMGLETGDDSCTVDFYCNSDTSLLPLLDMKEYKDCMSMVTFPRNFERTVSRMKIPRKYFGMNYLKLVCLVMHLRLYMDNDHIQDYDSLKFILLRKSGWDNFLCSRKLYQRKRAQRITWWKHARELRQYIEVCADC